VPLIRRVVDPAGCARSVVPRSAHADAPCRAALEEAQRSSVERAMFARGAELRRGRQVVEWTAAAGPQREHGDARRWRGAARSERRTRRRCHQGAPFEGANGSGRRFAIVVFGPSPVCIATRYVKAGALRAGAFQPARGVSGPRPGERGEGRRRRLLGPSPVPRSEAQGALARTPLEAGLAQRCLAPAAGRAGVSPAARVKRRPR
jgi:hypothetical protein